MCKILIEINLKLHVVAHDFFLFRTIEFGYTAHLNKTTHCQFSYIRKMAIFAPSDLFFLQIQFIANEDEKI